MEKLIKYVRIINGQPNAGAKTRTKLDTEFNTYFASGVAFGLSTKRRFEWKREQACH